eukprot:ANDGO_08123.mRNA.1 hypothetical protein
MSSNVRHRSFLKPLEPASAPLGSVRYESLDYQTLKYSPFLRVRSLIPRFRLLQWITVATISVSMAIVAFGISTLSKYCTLGKFSAINSLIQQGYVAGPFFLYAFFNMFFALIACFLVIWEPGAAGSGIPEVKSYLNGVVVPRTLRWQTFVAKSFGISFAVSSGLPLGKEGPCIHIGAVIAGAYCQHEPPKNAPMWWRRAASVFRADRDRRDMVASGSACGVAAAFGAPIGGVLFAIEEAASFWSQSLTWRTFFGSILCSAVLAFFLSGTVGAGWGRLSDPGLLSFGYFPSQPSFLIWELPIFAFMGAVGGLTGSLYVFLNRNMSVFRQKFVAKSRVRRVMDVVLLSFLVSVCSFMIPYALRHDCTPLPSAESDNDTGGHKVSDIVSRFYCPDGEYSSIATLFFAPSEASLRALFHVTDAFSSASLLLFAPIYFCLMVLTFGAALPSGLFVPSLLTGACFGRLVGHLLHFNMGISQVVPGTYALIGAAAVLGGVTRMTVSVAVIVIEATNDIRYGLPLALTILCAKISADLINKGVYDTHLSLRKVPFLESELPTEIEGVFSVTDAASFMSQPVACLQTSMPVTELVDVLRRIHHHAYPVLNTSGVFVGIAHRRFLLGALREQFFVHSVPEHTGSMSDLTDMECITLLRQSRAGDEAVLDVASRVSFSGSTVIDVFSLCHEHPITVHERTSILECFEVFRSVGLRHLVVLDDQHHVSGIVTRHNFINAIHVVEHELEHIHASHKSTSNSSSLSEYLMPPSDQGSVSDA